MSRHVSTRPTSWWLDTLRRRAQNLSDERLDLSGPPPFSEPRLRAAALKFFNAAYRAEQSGLTQAHELADTVKTWDPDLAEVLRLYGEEEGWHRQLLDGFLAYLGGGVQPMGRVTGLLFRTYARARRMETIVLANLMFETIGSTTYRLALRKVEHPEVRKMLTILTRDESFHVPLNVFFLKKVLERTDGASLARLQIVHGVLFVVLVLLPLASRPKSQLFDQIELRELMRAYARELAALFMNEPEIPLTPPWFLLSLLGVSRDELRARGAAPTSELSAERAAQRENVVVASA